MITAFDAAIVVAGAGGIVNLKEEAD